MVVARPSARAIISGGCCDFSFSSARGEQGIKLVVGGWAAAAAALVMSVFLLGWLWCEGGLKGV